MKKPLCVVLIVLVLIVLFLIYRYFTFGKGNKQLSYPTLFGWPRYDYAAAEKDGLVKSETGGLVQK